MSSPKTCREVFAWFYPSWNNYNSLPCTIELKCRLCVFFVSYYRGFPSYHRGFPPELERVVVRCGHDAPPVRKHGNAADLRRRHIITKVQWTPQRTVSECPRSVATHLPVATSHTLSVLSPDADTTRRPSGNTATLLTYDAHTSSQKYSGRRNAPNASTLSASSRICRSPRPTP